MKRILLEYFSYSVREIRSLSVILIILFISLGFRLLLPLLDKGEIEPDPDLIHESLEYAEAIKKRESVTLSSNEVFQIKDQQDFFSFDPNTADREDLHKLGFNRQVVINIIRYRDAGGSFRSPKDLRKIYGLDTVFFERIKPWITINNEDHQTLQMKRDDLVHITENRDINRSDFPDLAFIAGESIISRRILRYRDLLGGFHHMDQLKEVYEMSDSLFEVIEKNFYPDSSSIIKLSLGLSSYGEFLRHPYLEKEHVNLIMKYREFSAERSSLSEFLRLKILPDSVIALIMPYLEE